MIEERWSTPDSQQTYRKRWLQYKPTPESPHALLWFVLRILFTVGLLVSLVALGIWLGS